MRISRYAVFFLLIAASLFFVQAVKIDLQGFSEAENVAMNDTFDRALDAALDGIVDVVDGDTIQVRRQQCVNNFYRGLYAGMGIMDNDSAKELVQLYVPVLAFIDNNGIYVQYSDYDATSAYRKVWSQLYPFTISDDASVGGGPDTFVHYCVNYTLGTTIQVLIGNEVYEGDWNDLHDYYASKGTAEEKAVFSSDRFADINKFTLYKNSAVIDTITDTVEYYVSRHNAIASRYGISYTFYLPEGAYSDFNRSVTDISFLAVMQGYPIGIGDSDVFNRYALSGARIRIKDSYVIQTVDGFLYYHKESCKMLDDSKKIVGTKEECAMHGAMPCPYCKP